MSLKTVLVTIEETALADLKQLGGVIEHTVISLCQKLVAEVKETDLGTRAMNLISDLASKDLSGSDKMAKLLGDIQGDVDALHKAGGLKGLEASAVDFAKEFAQSSFNDFVAASKKA